MNELKTAATRRLEDARRALTSELDRLSGLRYPHQIKEHHEKVKAHVAQIAAARAELEAA
jgi:hypothetical protein